jgi:hypothetical protein
METTRSAAAVACLVLGVAVLPSAGQEKPPPISRQALLGRWEGRSGTITVTVTFEPRTAAVRMGGPPDSDGPARYKVCRKCNEVRIRGLGRGQLVDGDRLRITLSRDRLSLPKGTAITLSRLMAGDGK